MSDEKTQSFLESLGDDYKGLKELETFKSAKDLAKSYVSLSKAFNDRTEGVSGKEEWPVFQEKSSKFFKLSDKEEDYDVETDVNKDDVKKLGFEFKLHPKQAKGFAEGYLKALTKINSDLEKEKIKEFDIRNDESFKGILNKDEMIAKALNHSKIKLDDFKKTMGVHYNNPDLQALLYNTGKALTGDDKSEKSPAITTKKSVETKETFDDKVAYVKNQLRSDPVKGPLYDKTNPKHAETSSRVDRYTKEIAAYAKENNIKVNLLYD